MEHEHPLHDLNSDLPLSFAERIVLDISEGAWIQLLQKEPILKESLLEGFSTRPNKIARALRQPQIRVRLRRLILSDTRLLDRVLQVWAHEQLETIAFLEMLDQSFVLENLLNLKDFVGPERLFACLYLLGYLKNEDLRGLINKEYWERHVRAESAEFLVPMRSVLKEFVQEHPEAAEWFADIQIPGECASAGAKDGQQQKLLEQWHGEEKKRHKLEAKLTKALEEHKHLQEEIMRYRRENEELRKQAAEWEHTFEKRLQEALVEQHRRWFERYQGVDTAPLKDARERLDSLLKRADRAFELQSKADEEFGLVSSVRQKMAHMELILKEIERIYADSLVVHTEVAKVKEALLQEKKRLLQLPGIEKVLREDSTLAPSDDLQRRIRLLEPDPENLGKLGEVQRVVSHLEKLGLLDNAEELKKEIRQKRLQILEILYARFQPPRTKEARNRHFRSFEDFLKSGQSRKYDLYIDGYNILLKVQGEKKTRIGPHLTELREAFIRAVSLKSHFFRKVCLVFDGVEESVEKHGNVEIIYSDKIRGDTADVIIIQHLRKRKDKQAILVTADHEIIEAVEHRIYATVDPYHFYMFVFDINLPTFTED